MTFRGKDLNSLMKRIDTLEIKHFKAFRDVDPIQLDGRNLLLYGPNGSGKSSIYWALYTLLESSTKAPEDVNKYFDASHPENLINIFSRADGNSASLAMTIKDEAGSATYRLSNGVHDTIAPEIVLGLLASDFVTYRVLFRFYHFTNAENINLFPVINREILPFCSITGSDNLGSKWAKLRQRNPFKDARINKKTGIAAKNIYEKYNTELKEFSTNLRTAIEAINEQAMIFFTKHFQKTGEKITYFKMHLVRDPKYVYKDTHELLYPLIGLEVEIDGVPIPKPQSHLNEAKLTQIAIAIRFGATIANAYEDASFKVLVLDDLLISLDMSNRMKIVSIILNEPCFADYQKIIMTHERGFYQEVRRRIGSDHTNWTFKKLHCKDGESPKHSVDLDSFELAENLIANNRLEEASVLLRKKAEASLKRFCELKLGMVFESGQYSKFSDNLRKAKHKLEEKSLFRLREMLKSENINKNNIEMIFSISDAARYARARLDETSFRKLQHSEKKICLLLKETLRSNGEAICIIDQIKQTTDRVLNSGAHPSDSSLYSSEVQSALTLIRRLHALAGE